MIPEKELIKNVISNNIASLTNDNLLEFKNYDINDAKRIRDNCVKFIGSIPSEKTVFSFIDLQNMAQSLINSKVYKIDDSIKNILLNTDVDIKNIRLPFSSIYLQTNLEINDNYYIPGVVVWDFLNEDNKNHETDFLLKFKDKELEELSYQITYIIANKQNDEKMLCSFFINEHGLYEDENSKYKTDLSEVNKIFIDKKHKIMIKNLIFGFLKMLYNPEVEVRYKEYSEAAFKRREKENKKIENYHYIKVTGKLKEYVDNFNNISFSREYLRTTNSWIVRGYYKKLESEFFKNKKGQEIFIPPFVCGFGKVKDKTYIVGEKVIWKNQLLMTDIIRELFPEHLVINNSRGYLNGLEIDCYIPDLKLGFEYNGKQHYEFVNIFHKNEDDLQDIKKRDKIKNKLAKERGITLITIDYTEEITKELIIKKLQEISSKKIVKIEEIDERETFDIQVEDNNNFYLAIDVLSKNSGKTTAMMSTAQKYHDSADRRLKIFDLWGGERNEQYYWALPSQDTNYWGKIKKKFHLDEEGPKQYKVKFLFPMTRSLPDKLPNDPANNIQSQIYTIPINNLTSEHASFVLGVLPNEANYLWMESKEKISKKDSAVKFKHIMNKLGGSNRTIYKHFVAPLVREGMLSAGNADTNLDVAKEARDQETITVFSFEFVPKEFKLFALAYVIDQLSKGYDAGTIKRHSIELIRESSEFFRATDQAIVEDKYKIFRVFLSQAIKMGRKGCHYFCDCQAPAEVKGIVSGQQDLTILGKLPAEVDRKFATDQMARDNLITSKQIQDIGMLEPGQYYICETSKKAAKRYFFLPRSMYWKPGYGNFMENVWKKLRDKWKDVSDEKANILKKIDDEEKEIAEHEKLLKELKESKEKAAKEAKELKEQQDKEEKLRQEIELKENLRTQKLQERLELKQKYDKKKKKRRTIEDDSEEFTDDNEEDEENEIKEVNLRISNNTPTLQEPVRTSVDEMDLF